MDQLDWKHLLIWAFALFFTGDSILRAIRSNFNLGTFLMYCITAGLWIYAVFYRPLRAFFVTRTGGVLRDVFITGVLCTAAVAIFLAVAGHTGNATGRERAVIVLGAGLRGTRVSGLLARRLNAAYLFYEENPQVTIVVTGGQGPQEAIPEALAMRAYLLEKGVPATHILLEDKSESTEENFVFAREILTEYGIDASVPIAYVTNTFHCYRAGRYAAAAGFTDISSIPASTSFSSVLPCYLREIFAVLYYWVFRR